MAKLARQMTAVATLSHYTYAMREAAETIKVLDFAYGK